MQIREACGFLPTSRCLLLLLGRRVCDCGGLGGCCCCCGRGLVLGVWLGTGRGVLLGADQGVLSVFPGVDGCDV